MDYNLKHRQKGASMVEMALVLMLFVSLIFAAIEFSLAVFYAVRLSEATRIATRVAIVDNATIENVTTQACSEIDGFKQCTAETCPEIVKAISGVVNIEPSSIHIRYQCANTGFTQTAGFVDATHEIYNITVRLQGVEYSLILPGILGLGAKIPMPSFETSRLSEDLWSKSK